jgi:hypothetical protein
MNEKTFQRSADDLKLVSSRYATMRTHLESLFTQAKRLAEDQDSPMKGQGLRSLISLMSQYRAVNLSPARQGNDVPDSGVI